MQRCILELTGEDVSTPAAGPVFVPSLETDGGGQGNGYIDPSWWRTSGIPIVIDRWAAVTGTR
ncbi:MAG: hypothetical protein JWP75_2549 [Frondihabitans sp.]|nr:hypothetical protein [Frondihabitans sp.]